MKPLAFLALVCCCFLSILPGCCAASASQDPDSTLTARDWLPLPLVTFGGEPQFFSMAQPASDPAVAAIAKNDSDKTPDNSSDLLPKLSSWADGQVPEAVVPNAASQQRSSQSQTITVQRPQPPRSQQAEASGKPPSGARNLAARQPSSTGDSTLLAQQPMLDPRLETAVPNSSAESAPNSSAEPVPEKTLIAGGGGAADSGGGQVVPAPPDQSTSSPAQTAPNPNAPAPVQSAPAVALRRALPGPYDPVFPSTEFLGVSSQIGIGVPDTDPVWPLEKAIYKECPWLQQARIKIYGWTNPGMDYSTSHKSNIPMSYSIVPNKPQLDQQIFRIERIPDTVQTEHWDWGFRSTLLYGIDYRWTTAEGWYPASHELLHQNSLYGMDPVEQYGVVYIPKVAKGLVLKFGRFISPSDIEAQLAPDNYLWTHSLMFTYDNYTQTGLLASVKLCDHWTLQAGIHAGADIAPWAKAAIPTGEFNIRYIAPNNKDSLYLCCNSINDGKYRASGQHDNLQEFTIDWSHVFTRRFHTVTEAYWLYEFDDLKGGTVVSPPNIPAFALTGAGVPVHGMAYTLGFVNYTNYAVTSRDYLSLRPLDFLIDPRGMRTGFNTWVSSWTLGWIHRFSDLTCIRPEIRYEHTLWGQGPYDNGTRRHQFTVGFDVIQRF